MDKYSNIIENQNKIQAAKLLLKYGSPNKKAAALAVLDSMMSGGPMSDQSQKENHDQYSNPHTFDSLDSA